MEDCVLLNQFAKGKPVQIIKGCNCIIYTRVSTKEQAETNMSLTTQLKACEFNAQKQLYQVKGIFGGTYESAKNDERKEFNRMLTFAKKSKEKISYILVYSVDRFSRSGANAIYIKEQLKTQGIHLLAVSQITDTETPSGNLQQNIQFIFSEYDNQLRREKCMNGTREALLRGEWTAKAPIGYDSLQVNGKREITVNEKGKLLYKAFIWKINEQINNIQAIQRLAKLGLKIPSQTMSGIFRNPFYCGYMSHNLLGGVLVKGNHEALISPELFLRIHNISNGKHKFGFKNKHQNDNIPLKNFLKCDHCNNNMAGYVIQKKGLWYYKCRIIGCKNNKSANELHACFENELSHFSITNTNTLELIREQFKAIYSRNHEEIKDDKTIFQNRVKEMDSKIVRLEERYIEESLTLELFTKYKLKYQEERQILIIELQNLSVKVSNLDKCLSNVTDKVKDIANLWTSSAYNEKVKLQYMIFPKGIHYSKKTNLCRTNKINFIWDYIITLKEQAQVNEKHIAD